MNDAPVKDLIRLSQAYKIAEELTGEPVDQRTPYNWAERGVLDVSRTRQKLKTTRRLGRHCTTREWVMEFLESLA